MDNEESVFIDEEFQPKADCFKLISKLKKQLEISIKVVSEFEAKYGQSKYDYVEVKLKDKSNSSNKKQLQKEWDILAHKYSYNTHVAIVRFLRKVIEYINLLNNYKSRKFFVASDLESLLIGSKKVDRDNSRLISAYENAVKKDKECYNNEVSRIALSLIDDIVHNDVLYHIRSKEKRPFQSMKSQSIIEGSDITFQEVFDAMIKIADSSMKVYSREGHIDAKDVSIYAFDLLEKLDRIEESVVKIDTFDKTIGYKDDFLELRKHQILETITSLREVCKILSSSKLEIQEIQMRIMVINNCLKVLHNPKNLVGDNENTVFKEAEKTLLNAKKQCTSTLAYRYNVTVTVDNLQSLLNQLNQYMDDFYKKTKKKALPKHYGGRKDEYTQKIVDRIREEALFQVEITYGRVDDILDEYTYNEVCRLFKKLVDNALYRAHIEPIDEDYRFPYSRIKSSGSHR